MCKAEFLLLLLVIIRVLLLAADVVIIPGALFVSADVNGLVNGATSDQA